MTTLNFQVMYPLNDTKITLDNCDLTKSVKSLKTEISEKLNCAQENLVLVLLGNILEEETSINDLNLTPWSLIHVIVRDEEKYKKREFEAFTEEQIVQLSKSFSKLQYSNFRKLIRPEAVKKILDAFPEFRNDKIAISILKDSILLASMQHIETLRKFNENHRVLLAAGELILKTIYEMSTLPRDAIPMITDDLSDSSSSSSDTGGPSTANGPAYRRITPAQLAEALALASTSSINSLANIAQRNLSESSSDVAGTGSGGPSTSSAPSSSALNTRITSSMFSNALSQAMSDAQYTVPEPIVTPPTDMQANQLRYESELQTMREMGLVDAEVNLQALMLCNGDVDAAINLLFSGAIA